MNRVGRTVVVHVGVRTVLTVCFLVLGVAALVYFLLKVRVALTLMLAAMMMATALHHVLDVLVRHGMRRAMAIGLVVLVLLGIAVGFGFLLIPPALAQGSALVAEAPVLWERLQHTGFFLALDARFSLQEQLRQSTDAARGAINPLLSALGGILTTLGAGVTLLFLSISMLVFGPGLVAALLKEMGTENRVRYERIGTNIYHSVGRYLGGLLGICSVNALLTTSFLAIVRVPFFLPLGILSGLSSLIPYAGLLVMGSTITLLTWVTGGVWKALATAIYFVLYGQLEGNVLGPLVNRRTAHVNPLVTFLAILFLAEFMGVAGAVLAVPLAATAQIVVREILSFRSQRLTEGVR